VPQASAQRNLRLAQLGHRAGADCTLAGRRLQDFIAELVNLIEP
jgi:hypothetical protein